MYKYKCVEGNLSTIFIMQNDQSRLLYKALLVLGFGLHLHNQTKFSTVEGPLNPLKRQL